MDAHLMLIHCLSPLHAGTGQGVGAVDLPIAREVTTNLPYLPGSSIKGTLRDRCRQQNNNLTFKMFGPETNNASDHAGALSFGDARLLCLPVRSVYGTFAWASSPLLIQRLRRDVQEVSNVEMSLDFDALVGGLSLESVHVTTSSMLLSETHQVYLEEFDFQAQANEQATQLAHLLGSWIFDNDVERDLFAQRFLLVHDDVMSFLSRHAVEIVTRTSIDEETRVVKRGQLWTEENLPSETILSSVVMENGQLAKMDGQSVLNQLPALCQNVIQFGGNATVGRGRSRVIVPGGAL